MIPKAYMTDTLVVDLFDTHTKCLIWRGVATDTWTEKEDTEKFNKAVERMFKDFPHKGK
jgi:hypothetical protein